MLDYKKNITIVLFSIIFSAVNYNLELVHNLRIDEYNSNSNFGVSDVWGYTDETGIEYAIVGYRYGTFIYDVSSSNDAILIIVSRSFSFLFIFSSSYLNKIPIVDLSFSNAT